jgi:hypothetical protein
MHLIKMIQVVFIFTIGTTRGCITNSSNSIDYNVCTRDWPDVCPQSGGGPVGCTPYAPPPLTPTNWYSMRAQLVNNLFGVNTGQLPTNGPDYIEFVGGNTSRGCWCATQGYCNSSDCSWSSNMTRLIHTVSVVVNTSFTITLNSTVFWSLNTSGVAPVTINLLAPQFPQNPFPPLRLSDTLVIVHQGHDSPCFLPNGDYDFDGTVDFFNQLGYDVANHHMPTYQINAENPYNVTCDHQWFAQFEMQGAPIMRFFLEPVVRTINYALNTLGYKRIVMAGLSGGGWSTVMLAAIDPRITLSIPVAGSMPCDFQHTSWDFEQYCNNSWAMVANYTSLYVLGALEKERTQVQVLHEQDPCCFHACGRHDRIRGYNEFVQAEAQGNFVTAATQGNAHEVNGRDKTIIASLVDQLRITGSLSRSDIDQLPFNTMREW